MKKFALLAAMMAYAHVSWAATPLVTRTYQGPLIVEALGFPQSADVLLEITGSEAAFDRPAGATFTIRGRIEGGSPLVRTVAGRWSNYIKAVVSNEPVRADVVWEDGEARIGLSRYEDWSLLTVAAQGLVAGIDALLPESTLRVASVVTNKSTTTSASGLVDALPPEVLASFELVGKKNRFSLVDSKPTRRLYSAEQAGDHVILSFEPLGFEVKEGDKKTDGGVAVFWQEGSKLVGGIFDWHGVGQVRKTMDNIPGGYLDGRQPPEGATVWFCILAYGYQQRTTLAQAPKPWRGW